MAIPKCYEAIAKMLALRPTFAVLRGFDPSAGTLNRATLRVRTRLTDFYRNINESSALPGIG
jgi:hypothetical protein